MAWRRFLLSGVGRAVIENPIAPVSKMYSHGGGDVKSRRSAFFSSLYKFVSSSISWERIVLLDRQLKTSFQPERSGKPEFRLLNRLQELWPPVFAGVTTFYGTINLHGFVKSPPDSIGHFDRREKSSVSKTLQNQDFSLRSK
jgi:hypothetical protein